MGYTFHGKYDTIIHCSVYILCHCEGIKKKTWRKWNETKECNAVDFDSFYMGTAFVAQSSGMDFMEPFTFNGIRNLIGAASLLPCIVLFKKMNEKNGNVAAVPGTKKDLIIGGVACGILLFTASSLQQIGLVYTTAGKAGFITACYIVIVPLLGVFLHKKIGWKVWLAVGIALVGLYFLCITESLSIGKGDLYVLFGALVFSLHILVIDHFSPKVDGVKMSCIQFLVCGVVSMVPMFLLETPSLESIFAGWFPLLYAGVFSSGVAYTLQIVAQKNMNPANASLILSMESCFAVLAGWLMSRRTVVHKRECRVCFNVCSCNSGSAS